MLNNYIGVIIASFKKGFVYKVDNLLSIVNRIIEVSVLIFIWYAISGNEGQINGMSISNLIIYYALAYSLGHIMTWGINEYMATSIKKGRINMELLYPINYMKYFFCYKLGNVFRQLIVISIPTLIALIILFKIKLSFSIVNILLFLLITSLSIIIIFFIEFIFGLMSFYTTSGWGLQILKKSLITILSGQIAPIQFFPNIIVKIMNILPFTDLIYSPITTLLGLKSSNDIILILCRQSIWIIFLFILSKIIYNKAIKNVTIYGG